MRHPPRLPVAVAIAVAVAASACSAPVEPVPEALPAGLVPEGCTGAGWCWVRGAPVSVAEDRGAVYAVGLAGRLLLWKDGRWVDRSVPTSRAMVSAWIGGPDNQWASDDEGAVWRWDGKAWSEVPPNRQVVRLQGTADGALFALAAPDKGPHGISTGGHLLRRDGDAWVEPAPPAEYCFAGSVVALGHDDLWSTGLYCDEKTNRVAGGEVRRWDGQRWQLVGERFPGLDWYTRLAVVDGRVLFNDGYTWDGTSWKLIDRPGYPQGLPFDVNPIWTGADYLLTPRWLGCDGALRLDGKRALCWGRGQIHLWDGAGFTPTLPDPFAQTAAPARFSSLPAELWAGGDTVMAWGTEPGDVYRVRGSTGQKLERFGGETWSTLQQQQHWVTDLDGSSGELWFTTDKGPYWISYEQTEPVPGPIDPPGHDPADFNDQIHAVRVLAHNLALLASGSRLRLYEDGNWSVLRDAPDRHAIADVAGTSLRDLYLLEKETGRSNTFWLYHFDGAAWTEVPVEGLSYTAHLDTWGHETWLSTRDVIVNLATGKRYDLDQWTSGEQTRLRVDSAGLWVTTAHQARWHAR